jgi:hypothetical protein
MFIVCHPERHYYWGPFNHEKEALRYRVGINPAAVKDDSIILPIFNAEKFVKKELFQYRSKKDKPFIIYHQRFGGQHLIFGLFCNTQESYSWRREYIKLNKEFVEQNFLLYGTSK